MPITLLIVVVPAPPTVRPKPDPVIVPVLIVSKPASELIREFVPSVTVPAQTLVPLIFRRAPSLLTPDPFSVSPSPVTVMPPWICKAAELLTVVVPPVVPKALEFWILSAPAPTVIPPVNAFEPESVSRFVPNFVSVAVPVSGPLIVIAAEAALIVPVDPIAAIPIDNVWRLLELLRRMSPVFVSDIEFPPSVNAPAPELNVIEMFVPLAVVDVKSLLLVVSFVVPAKNRLSPPLGALPPQLLAVDQLLPIPPPFQVLFTAWLTDAGSRTASTIASIPQAFTKRFNCPENPTE